jgi:hypothetical protein
MTKEALNLALEALENSVDLVREDAYNAEELYGNYPARQGKVRGLKVLADDHEKAITAIKAALEAKDDAVAWMWMPTGEITTDPDKADGMWEPLFLAPPQRTWVGMTDEDFLEACQIAERGNYLVAFQRIQAKLRSKNHEI